MSWNCLSVSAVSGHHFVSPITDEIYKNLYANAIVRIKGNPHLMFVPTKLLNELRYVESQVWSGFEFVRKPDQPGLSSSIRLKVVMEQN